MNAKKQILNFLRSNKKLLNKKYGILSIGLYGSIALENEKSSSDIDIMIEVDKRFKRFDLYLDLKEFLKKNTGREIDIVYKNNMNPLIKYEIEKKMIYA